VLIAALIVSVAFNLATEADDHPQTLEIGSFAPDFHLPGVDGKIYSLADFKEARILAVIFTAVHCPTAEAYENRIKATVSDYKKQGVAFVVIQPNSPKGLRLL
jgi:peroxiredoxin